MSSGPSPEVSHSWRATTAISGRPEQVVAVVARHHVLARARTLCRGADDDGVGPGRGRARARSPRSACPPSVSWQQSSRCNGSTMQRRLLVLLERDRLLVEPRLRGVAACLRSATATRPRSSLVAPVSVQVALRRHRHPRGRREEADRQVRRRCASPASHRRAALDAGAEAASRALVEGAVADDHVGHARGQRPAPPAGWCRTPPHRRSGCG